MDGKYRYETGTNDLNPQFKSYIETGVNGYAKWNTAVSNLNRTPRLIDIYGKDNELFKAYPQLKSIEVELVSDKELGAKGAADIKENKIYINSKVANENSAIVPSILEHEVQHFIQEYEGFAKGGNQEGIKINQTKFKDKELIIIKKGIDYYFKTQKEKKLKKIIERFYRISRISRMNNQIYWIKKLFNIKLSDCT